VRSAECAITFPHPKEDDMSDVTPVTDTPTPTTTTTTGTDPGTGTGTGTGTAPATSTSVDFNITLELGNPPKQVTIFAQDLADVATKGLHFALPPDTIITLGSLKDLITWLNAQLVKAGITDATIPSAAGADWPQSIADIFNGVLTAVVQVTRFTLDQDPKIGTPPAFPPLRFTLDVTGTAVDANGDPKPIPIIKDLFSVVGGGIGLSHTYAGAPITLQLSGGGTARIAG
jgi:hypothetical protein